MESNEVENLSEAQIMELYNDVVETNSPLLTRKYITETTYYCDANGHWIKWDTWFDSDYESFTPEFYDMGASPERCGSK